MRPSSPTSYRLGSDGSGGRASVLSGAALVAALRASSTSDRGGFADGIGRCAGETWATCARLRW
ncbi:hypothetical protein AB0L97_20425 [Nocardia sp. NPDC051911]|uniref:hypothetical protein n=1 Tax=Nocardia sp. NPDC051911 TaxID=3154648 RepID=UPI003435CBD0